MYEIGDLSRESNAQTLLPRPAGRPAECTVLTVDKELVNRAIVTLPLWKWTVRDVRLGLDLLPGITRSVGYISQTQTATTGKQAQASNLGLCIFLPILGGVDEIFQGRQTYLTVADGRSFLVVNLTPAKSRDGDTLELTLLELQKRGIRFNDLAGDEGRGLLAGVEEAALAVPLRLDLFYLLRGDHRLTQRTEKATYKAMEIAERARRAEWEAQGAVR